MGRLGWSPTWIPETFLCNPPNLLAPFSVSFFLPLPPTPSTTVCSQKSLPLSTHAQWPGVFSGSATGWWRRGRERGHTRKGSFPGTGGSQDPQYPALSPRSDPRPPTPRRSLLQRGAEREPPLFNPSRSARLLPIPERSSSSPPTPPQRSGTGGAPGGSWKGRGERRREEAVRLRGSAAAGSARARTRAHASPRLGRRAAGGGAGLRAEEPRAGRAERAAGGARGGRARASWRAGERVASPPASAVAAFARSSETDGRTDRGQTWALALGSGPALARLGACSARSLPPRSRPPRLRRPQRAGGWRCGSGSPPVGPRAAQPRPPRRGPELRPRSPALLRAAPNDGAPGLQTRAAGASVFMNPEDVREALQGS